MKRRTNWVILVLLIVITACVDKTPSVKEPLDLQELTKNQKEDHGTQVTAADITLTTPLNAQWVTEGKSIFSLVCLVYF